MSDFSTVSDPDIDQGALNKIHKRFNNQLQCNWYGVVAYVNSTNAPIKESNYFAFKHLHVVTGHTTYAEMVAYAKKIFEARNAVKTTPKPPAATVVVTSVKGFLEMDTYVAGHAGGSHLLVPVYNGAIIRAGAGNAMVAETAAEIEVSTRKDKDRKCNVFHFKGVGKKAWDPNDENVQLIPFWMFG